MIEVSQLARLLLLGLISNADDDGRLSGAPKAIRARVFPADETTPGEVSGLLGELSEHGLVELYEAGGKRYISLPGFKKHQRVDRPQKSKLPPPPSATVPEPVEDGSADARRPFDERSTNDLRTLDDGSQTEWNGREGNGKDVKHTRRPKADGPSPKKSKTAWSEDEAAVFEHWVATFGKTAAVHKSTKRRNRIRALLKRLGLKETLRLVTELRRSKFHTDGGYIWFKNKPLSCPDAAEAFLANVDEPVRRPTIRERLAAMDAGANS